MLDARVKDVMTRPVVSLSPSDSVLEAAKRLGRRGISGGPVVDNGTVIGMISATDLVCALMPASPREKGGASSLTILAWSTPSPASPWAERPVAEVMTTKVIAVSPETSIWEAAAAIDRRKVNRLPVIDRDGRVLGILSRADLVKAIAMGANRVKASEIGTRTKPEGTVQRAKSRTRGVGPSERQPALTGILARH
jgi:CBS domain-containing protein